MILTQRELVLTTGIEYRGVRLYIYSYLRSDLLGSLLLVLVFCSRRS